MSRKIFNTLKNLILPEYLIITTFTIIAAGLINLNFNYTLIYLILIMTSLMIGLNCLNNIHDIHLDLINKPKRPLVQGHLKKQTVYFISVFSFLFALTIALFLNSKIFILTSIGIFLAIIYSIPKIRLKDKFLGANFIGGLIYGAIPFLLVLNVNSNNSHNQIFLILFFSLIFGIAPLKDIEDIIGEKKYGIITIATQFGPIRTIWISTSILSTTLFFFLFLSITNIIQTKYIIPSIISLLIIIILNQKILNELNKKHKRTTQSTIVTYAMLAIVTIELIYGLITIINL